MLRGLPSQYIETLIDWSHVAVSVPEADVAAIPDILARYSLDEVCQMRVNAFQTFHRYLGSFEAILDGVTSRVQEGSLPTLSRVEIFAAGRVLAGKSVALAFRAIGRGLYIWVHC